MYQAIRCVKLNGREVLLEVTLDESSVIVDDMDEIMHLNNIENFKEGDTIMKIKMRNADFECTWSDNQIKTANASSHIEVTVAIFRHILNLFKFSEKIELDLFLNSKEVKNFPVLEGVTATSLRGVPLDATTVEAFCEKYPTQKSFALASKLSGELNPKSPIFKVEDIYFLEYESRISTFPDNFTGRIGIIENAQFPTASIIQFMRKWMIGSAHQNLELFRVTFAPGHFIDRRIVVRAFNNEAKVSKRSENYEYNTQVIRSYKPNIFHYARFFEIERHSDGKKASFSVNMNWFEFRVWNIN
ncbi:unnamed protein product [Caenorhabditis brenneri]